VVQPLEQSNMFPDLIPDIVVRIWNAHFAHYKTGTRLPPTRKQLSDRLLTADPDKPGSESTIDRARRDYPKLLKPWPIRRGQQPSWLSEPQTLTSVVIRGPAPVAEPKEIDRVHWEAFDEYGNPRTVEAAADENGILRLARRPIMTIVASMMTFVLLDVMSDGRLDQIVRWCRLLTAMGHRVAA
jgi:hypothetical protein